GERVSEPAAASPAERDHRRPKQRNGTLARPTTRNPVWHMGEWGLSISQCHTAGSSYRHPRRDSARESILARVARLAHPTHIARPFGPSRIRKPEAVRF